jgi:hypothetical protein
VQIAILAELSDCRVFCMHGFIGVQHEDDFEALIKASFDKFGEVGDECLTGVLDLCPTCVEFCALLRCGGVNTTVAFADPVCGDDAQLGVSFSTDHTVGPSFEARGVGTRVCNAAAEAVEDGLACTVGFISSGRGEGGGCVFEIAERWLCPGFY